MSDFSLTAILSIPEESGYYFPDRHFTNFFGRPLFDLMVNKLEQIGRIDKIIINSDSDRIRNSYVRSSKVKVVNIYKAEPMEIEMELTSDKLTTAMLEQVEGEHFLQLGPVFPFLRHQTIENVIDNYDKYVINPEDWVYDSAFTIRTFNRRYFDSDAELIREDRPNTFIEDGIVHVFNRKTFVACDNRKVGKKPYACIVEEIENLAVDSEENYHLALLIEKNRQYFQRTFGR